MVMFQLGSGPLGRKYVRGETIYSSLRYKQGEQHISKGTTTSLVKAGIEYHVCQTTRVHLTSHFSHPSKS